MNETSAGLPISSKRWTAAKPRQHKSTTSDRLVPFYLIHKLGYGRNKYALFIQPAFRLAVPYAKPLHLNQTVRTFSFRIASSSWSLLTWHSVKTDYDLVSVATDHNGHIMNKYGLAECAACECGKPEQTAARYIDHHPKLVSSKLGHWPEHGYLQHTELTIMIWSWYIRNKKEDSTRSKPRRL